jgi:YD repeat-containing protein
MVAVVSGSGLGLFGSSGMSGAANMGRGRDQVFVNTATGNLILQSQDDVLKALGLDLALVRTYNSQGLMTDDNGDNWRLGVAQKVYNLQGTLNAAGSTITKVFGDGREVVYSYNTTLAKYVSTEGGGAHDTLTNSSGTWTWRDESGRNTETYNSSGQLTASKDSDGNTVSYTYNATTGLLTTITDASGQVTTLTYSGNNLTSISVSSNSVVQTVVRYSYDDTTNNRLKTVTVDLTPADNSVADNVVYTTTYTYDGTSKRVASITQTDGSTIAFTYQQINGLYRVKTFTDGMGRLTTLNYSSYSSGGAVYLQTDVVDALTRTTTYTQDSAGRLTSVLSPTVGGARLETRYGYDTDGNVTTITEDPTGLNRITTLGYDTKGNLLSSRDSLGNTVTRTYDNFNQILTEVKYVVPDPDGAGSGQPGTPLTTRYVYDGSTSSSESHLRFEIDADGRVTEHRYNTAGQRTATLNYLSALYTGSTFTESDLVTWSAVSTNKALLERVDYAYDFRDNVSSLTSYVSNDASTGAGTGTPSITKFVYDQRGQLLQTIEARGSANTPNPLTPNISYATTYTYDGLGRVLSATKWNSSTSLVTTLNAYDDANRKTATTLANGRVTTQTYDKAGELTSVANGTASATTSLGVTTYAYDAGGRLRILTDATSVVRQFFFYDEADRKVGAVDGDGTLTELVYDKASQLIKTIQYSVALSGTRLASLVDASGNPTAVTLATCRTEAGTSAATDQVSRNVYDLAGRLVYTIDEGGAVTQINYDGAGRVTDTILYANTIAVPRATDQVLPGDLTSTTSAFKIVPNAAKDRRTRTFYDNDGNQIGALDAAGYIIENVYDSGGHLKQVTQYANVTSSSLWASGTWAQLKTSASTDNETTIDPERDSSTYYYYDGQGRNVGELDAEGYLTETVYDVAGKVTQTIRYDKVLTWSASSTLASLKTQANTSPVASTRTTSYQYDGAGRVTQTINYQGTQGNLAYDSVGNLISSQIATGTGEARLTQIRYDLLGRVGRELSGEGSQALATFMAANPSATQAQIDAVWDQYGVVYAYDLAGRRITATSRPNGSQTNITRYYYDNDGRVRFEVNQLGERNEYRYNALGQVSDKIVYFNRISVTSLGGGLLTPTLLSTLTASADSTKDAKTSYSYTLTGRLNSTTTVEGASTTFTYNAFGENDVSVTQIDASRSVRHEFTYDKRGLLTNTKWDAASGGLGTTELRTYDAFGRVTQITDQRGNVSKAEYDRLGRTTATVDALGGRRLITYDGFSRTLTTRDALSNTSTYSYNDSTRTMTVTTPGGVAISTVYNRHGQTLSVTSAGNTTSYTYDRNGKLTGTSDSLGTLLGKTYDRSGRVLTSTDARGIQTTFTYDAANRVLTSMQDSATGGLALTTTYVYDGEGRLTDVTEPSGRLTRTSYDRDGRVTQVAVDPNGLNLRTAYAYDKQGNQLTVTEGFGGSNPRTTQYTYDNLGRRTSEVVDPGTGKLNLTTQYKYDAANNLSRKIDARGYSTWYVYDAANRLTHIIDALGGVTQSTYDAENRVASTRRYAASLSASTMTTLAGLDAPSTSNFSISTGSLDRLTRSYYDTDGREQYTINAAGIVTQRLFDSNGNVTRLRTLSTPALTGTYANTAAVTTALGSAATTIGSSDRVRWTAYDLRGRAEFTMDALGAVVRNTYDAAGNVVKTTAFATLNSPTAATDLASLQTWATSNTNTRDRTTLNWYDGVGRVRFTLDAEGYLTEARYNDAGRQDGSIIYAAKPTGLSAASTLANVASAASAIAVAANDQSTTSLYDAAGRLSRLTDALGKTEYYGYDEVGNRTSFTSKKGSAAGDVAYTWNYEYDANGRMTYERTPAVDSTFVTESSPTAALSVTTTNARLVTKFEYDALGNLRFKREAFGTTLERSTEYVYDELGRQTRTNLPSVGISVYDGTTGDTALGNGTTVTRTELSTPSLYTEVAYNSLGDAYRSRDVAGNYSYKVYDNLGRVTYAVDAENYVTKYGYDAFSNETSLTRYANRLTSSLPTTGTIATSDITSRLNADTNADRTITHSYDKLNRNTWITRPTVSNFNPNAGSAGGTTFSSGQTTLNEYNAFGDLVRVRELVATSPSVYADTYLYYDKLGQNVARVDQSGYLTVYEYDETGDLKRQVEYAKPRTGTLSTTTYGTVVTTTRANSPNDPAGYDREILIGYDQLNRKVTETKVGVEYFSVSGTTVSAATVGNSVTTYGYDALGNLTSVKDNNNATSYTYYDVLGRTIAVADPSRDPGDGTTLIPLTRLYVDVFGNVVQQVAYGGGAVSIPSSGLPTAATAPTATPNRTTTMQLDRAGHVIRSTDATGANMFTSYNARGEIAKQWQVVTNPGSAGVSETLVTIYQYDKLGRNTGTVSPQKHTNSTTTVKITNVTEYNAFGEKIYQGVMDGSANQGRQEYIDYDLAGRVWRTNAGDGINKVFLYNMAGQATVELRSQTVDLKSSAYTSSADVVGLSGLMRTETRYDTRGNIVEQRLPSWTTSNGLEQVTTNAQIGAINGINYVYWTASPDMQSGARFEYRVAGSNSNWTTAPISAPQTGSLGARVEGLVNQPYEYRISYRYTGEMSPYAESSGTFRMDTGTVTSVSISRNVPDTSNDVATLSVSASGPLAVTNATIDDSSDWYVTGGTPNGGQWIYDNKATLTWSAIGASTAVRVYISYTNYNNNYTAGVSESYNSGVVSNVSTGGQFVWPTPNVQDTRGGLYRIDSVTVYSVDANGNNLSVIRQTGATGGPPKLIWLAPTNSGVTAVFKYKKTSDSSFSSVSATRVGGDFQVDVQNLLTASSMYDYEVEHWLNGTLVAKKSGQLNSTGVVTTRTASGTVAEDPLTSFNQTVATPFVNGLNMQWAPPSGATITPTFEYRVQGGSTYTPLGISQGANWSVNLSALSQNTTYEYQITYVLGNRVVSQQRGTFSIVFTPSSTTTTTSTSTDGAPTPINPVGAVAGVSGVTGASGVFNGPRPAYVSGQGGGYWMYNNELDLTFATVPPSASPYVRISVQFTYTNGYGQTGTASYLMPVIANTSGVGSRHVTFVCYYNNPGDPSDQNGRIVDSVTGVQVYLCDSAGNNLVTVRSTGATGSATPVLQWAAPTQGGLTTQFYVNGTLRSTTPSGGNLLGDVAGYTGTNNFEIRYIRSGEPEAIVSSTGQFTSNGVTTALVAGSQVFINRNPSWIPVTAAGNSVSWQRNADQGGSVSFSYYNGSSWVPVTASTSDGTTYFANFQGLASGSYLYSLTYSSPSGMPYVRSTGTVTVNTTTTSNSTVLNVSAPSFNQAYPQTRITPVSLSSDTISWSYAKQYSSSDTIVFSYTVNGTTYTPAVNGSGPSYSAVMAQLPFGSNMAVTWKIEYFRSGETFAYAAANGRATMTVTGTSTNPTVTVQSQTPAYPSGVAEISAPTDTGNNSLRWTTAANGASKSFTANGTALTISGSDAAGYTVDVSGLAVGTYTYEILYWQSGQNPFARARGTFTITRAAGPVATRSVSTNAAPGASSDPVTKDAQALNSNVYVGQVNAANHPDSGYYRSETRGSQGELYITYDWMPERPVVAGNTISGGYDRFGNLDASYTVTSGRYIYWSDPSDLVGESTPVVVWRTVGTSTWNTISTIEKVFDGARARFLGVKVATMGTGNIEYQIRYSRPGDSTPFAVRTGTINNPSTATGVTDTTAASITSTKTSAPSMSQTVDRWGSILTSTDAFGAVTNYRYNQFGQLVEKKLPSVSIVSVNAAGAMTSTTGTPTSLQYFDALGRLIATKDGNGNVDALTLNAAGQVTRDTHANSYIHKNTYDVFGNKVAETNERNFVTQYTYNGRNLLTKTVQDAGATPTFATANLITTQFFYDETGRRVAVIDGNNYTSRTWYDLAGNVRQTSTPLGYSKTYEYDLRGTKTKETDEIGGVLLWTYDYFGRLQNHNELGSSGTPGIRHDYLYNKVGGATSVTSTAGQNVTYKYDEAAHLIEVRESGTATVASGLTSVPRTSRFRYDLAGRHSRETTIIYNKIEQDALISYDAAGRLAAMWDKSGGTKISYDAANNRTRIQSSAAASQDDVVFTSSPFTFTWSTSNLISSGWYTQTNAWNTVDTDLWYAYDNMNRMAISRGALSGSTVSGGVKFTYDEVGSKKTRAEQGYVYTMGSGGKMTSSQGLTTDTYTYDGANRVTDVTKDGTVIEHYVYDKGSRQTTAVTKTVDTNSGGFLITRNQTLNYNVDNRLTSTSTTRSTTDPNNTGTKQESVVTYDNTDAAGVVRGYKVDAYKADGSAVQYSLRYNQSYRLGDSYQATLLAMTKISGTGGPNNNSTTQSYDLDGNLAFFQDQGASSNNRNYAVNADGQIIANGKSRYFFANGQNVGSLLLTSRQYVANAPSQVFGFAFNVDDGVVSGADVQTPSTVTAQDKDTLRAIAQRLYGDGSLWYVLAGENGLSDPDAELVEGMIIRVPNEVVSVGNNSGVYKPFDVSSAIGNTSPEQIFPYVPPPPAKKGCGIIGMIIMVVVAIVVSYFTLGAATGLVISALQGMGVATAAGAGAAIAAAGGAALAAAAGSIVSQGVGIAIGAQDKFSWGAVGKAFIGGAVGGALFGNVAAGTQGLLGGTSNWVSSASQAFGKAAPYVQAGINSAISNVLTQGISVAVGLQDKFSWREVAASAAGGAASEAAKTAIGDRLTNNLGDIPGKIVGDTLKGIASGVAQSIVRGGKINLVNIAADAFGNALGNGIIEGIRNAQLPDEVRQLAKQNPTAASQYRQRLSQLQLYGEERGVSVSDADMRSLAVDEVRFALDPTSFTEDAQDAHLDRMLGVFGADDTERSDVLRIVRTARQEAREMMEAGTPPQAVAEGTAPDIVVTGYRTPMSGIGKFINQFQDPLATLGSLGVKAGEFLAEHSWARWGLMAIEAVSSPLMFAGRQLIMHSPLGEKIRTLQETAIAGISEFANREGRINDIAKAQLVTTGAILGLGLAIGGVGLFAKLATTAGSFLRRVLSRRRNEPDAPPQPPGGGSTGGGAPHLLPGQRLQQAYNRPIQTQPGTHPAGARNDGVYGERVGLQTLENETGMRFSPLQNPSGHGADGVHIDTNSRTIFVAEVKSSQSGVANAATAQGNAATKLDEWARRSAGPESGWRTQNPANVPLAERIIELRAQGYSVQGVQVQVGVPAPGVTGASTVLINPW